jgi:hypothetical protein
MEAGRPSSVPKPHVDFAPTAPEANPARTIDHSPDDRFVVGVLWLYLLLLISGLVIARSAAAALFLRDQGPRGLGAVYVLVSLSVAVVVYGLSRIARSVGYERMTAGALMAAGFGAVAVRLAGNMVRGDGVSAWCWSLYVAVETYAFIAPLQFWTLSNQLFCWNRARQRYAFIASGGILGSVIGGAAARMLRYADPLDLFWLVAVLNLLAAGAPLLVRRIAGVREDASLQHVAGDAAPSASERLPVASTGRPTSDLNLLRWRRVSWQLGTVAFLTVATTTLADFFFKFRAAREFGTNATGLSQFFGNYYFCLGLTTLGLQVVVTRRVLRYEGVFAGLFLMPLGIGLATGLNVLHPTLFAATVLKLTDSSFSHSVGRSCREMLLTAVPARLVAGIYALTEGVCGRMGLLCCGAALMIAGPYLHPDLLLYAVGLCVLLWIGALALLRRTYESEFPETIQPVRHHAARAARRAEPVALDAAVRR